MFVTPLRCAWLWQARNEALGLLCNLSLRRGNRAQMSSQRLLDDLLPFMVLPHRPQLWLPGKRRVARGYYWQEPTAPLPLRQLR
jgi:hypothetical protein